MEKERYTIESFEIDEPSCIFDNKTQQGILSLVEYNYNVIVNLKNLLNQQDARIKELEEALKKAREREIIIHQNYKQSQNQKAIEELEKVWELVNSVEDENGYIFPFRDMNTRERFNQKLDNQIKELRGGEQ